LPENNGEEVDLSEVPPIGGLIVCTVLIVGLLSINFSTQTTVLTKWAFIIGSLAALLYIGFRFYQIKEDKGLQKAMNWLITPKKSKKKIKKEEKTKEKIKPCPEWLRTEIKLKRAEGKCEYLNCDKSTEYGEIHHIIRRSNPASSNDPGNLIYLCKKHHGMADNNVISQNDLKRSIRDKKEMNKKLRKKLKEKQ